MSPPLLATKLYLPRERPNRVSRPHLLERLRQGLLPGCQLVLVSAPAGFGKTTLAAEWAYASGLPAAWLSLDEKDNDPLRFWHYLIAALQTVDPALGRDMAVALDAPSPPPVESLLIFLVNDLIQSKKPLLLLLDDYHQIENRAIHEGLNFLLDHNPPDIHIAVMTRADPPLQLARRRARAELVELRAGDLRFTQEETGKFFQNTMRLALGSQDIIALEQRTEGWVAGLQMAAVAMQAQPADRQTFITAFTGDDRYIADYLVEEVLQHQTPEVQRFLLRTSILERFCAPLCDALDEQTAAPLPANGQEESAAAILDYLDRANLFLVPLDNRREWFRFHHLFAQLLRQRATQMFDPDEMRAFYMRAAHWHQKHDDPVAAVEYALASGDLEMAAGLMEQLVGFLFIRSELTIMGQWAERLPPAVLARHPSLCVALGWAANATGRLDLCEKLIRLVENVAGLTVAEFLEMDDAARRGLPAVQLGMLVELTVMRSRMELDHGRLAILETYAQILPYLVAERDQEPYIYNEPWVLRPPMLFMVAMARELQGQAALAIEGFGEAAELAEKLNNIHIVALALGHLGQIQFALGRLRDSEATFRRAVAIASRQGEAISAFFGISYVGLGSLAYERNDLDAAQQALERGIRLGKLWNSWEVQLPGFISQIRLALAREDLEGARQALSGLAELARNVPAVVSPLAEAWQARLWLAEGQISRAAAWARTAAADLPGPAADMFVERALGAARVWLAQNKAAQAVEILAAQSAAAEEAGQCSAWLRLDALRAVALDAAGRRDEALAVLGRVLNQAEEEGYTRSILDEGQPMARLLSAALEKGENRPVVVRLLAAFPGPTGADESLPPGLAEMLSPRELEVLGLLATDASNADIASQCYITVNTLKKHTASIYGKLGVSSRLQAVQRARLLKLI